MDLAKRAKMIDAALKIVADEVLTIPLHRQMIPWVSRANVSVIHRPSNFLTPMWVTIR
jgi:peptide/nickel transport system substrate-binding protein